MIALARIAGLSQLDLHALEQIEARGALTPRQVSECVGLSSGATTALIDRLERAGWVVRSPNPADRRSLVVTLSPRAERAGEGALGAYHVAVGEAVDRLPARDRKAVARFLEEITRAALAAGDPLWTVAGSPRA